MLCSSWILTALTGVLLGVIAFGMGQAIEKLVRTWGDGDGDGDEITGMKGMGMKMGMPTPPCHAGAVACRLPRTCV